MKIKAWLWSCEAFCRLIHTSVRLKRNGLNLVLSAIQSGPSPLNEPDMLAAHQIVEAVKSAAQWMPTRAACLEISVTTCLMARHRRIPVGLVIGVRHQPFMAHAWAVCGGEVITDASQTIEQFQPIYQIS